MKWTATTIVFFLSGTSILPTATAINGIRARASTHHEKEESANEFSKRLLQPIDDEDTMLVSTTAIDAASDLASAIAIVENNDDNDDRQLLSPGSMTWDMEDAKSQSQHPHHDSKASRSSSKKGGLTIGTLLNWFGNNDNNDSNNNKDVDILNFDNNDIDFNVNLNINTGTGTEAETPSTTLTSSTTSTNVCPVGGLPGTPEGEQCVSSLADDKNKDCLSETPIALGETICGTSSTYFDSARNLTSDVDKFRFTANGGTVIASLKADFPASVTLFRNGGALPPGVPGGNALIQDWCVLGEFNGQSSLNAPTDILLFGDLIFFDFEPGDYTLIVKVLLESLNPNFNEVLPNLDCVSGNPGSYTLTLTDTTNE